MISHPADDLAARGAIAFCRRLNKIGCDSPPREPMILNERLARFQALYPDLSCFAQFGIQGLSRFAQFGSFWRLCSPDLIENVASHAVIVSFVDYSIAYRDDDGWFARELTDGRASEAETFAAAYPSPPGKEIA